MAGSPTSAELSLWPSVGLLMLLSEGGYGEPPEEYKSFLILFFIDSVIHLFSL